MGTPPISPDLFALRREEQAASDALAQAEAAARSTRAAATAARANRADARTIFVADQRAAAAAGAFQVATDKLADVRRRIDDLQRHRPPVLDPDAPIANMPAAVPVLLLPVRMETRYTGDRTALRVCIFPDQLHTDTHEEPLTADELSAGRFYWQARWDASEAQESDIAVSAFAMLAQRFRPRRAGWIALATRPSNASARPRQGDPSFPTPPSRGGSWTRAALARFMPTEWTVTGYVRDVNGTLATLFQKRTVAVADPLHVGPDPQSTEVPSVDADGVATELPLDSGMRWTTDFAAAVAAGMALTVTNADLAQPQGQAARTLAATTIDRLVVHGVCRDLGPAEAAKRLEALLRAHRYTDGVAILKPGTPTNNTDAGAGNASSDAALAKTMDPDRFLLLPSGPRDALSKALGIDPAAAELARIEGGDFEDAATTGHMVNVLWASTIGYALDQFFGGELSDDAIERVRGFAVANLRPGGPLPTLRIGRQPYGILPVMALEGAVAADPTEGGVAQVVSRLADFWRDGATRAPTLSRRGSSLAENMQELLQQRPAAAANAYRRVLGPGAQANSNLDAAAAKKQEAFRQAVFDTLGITYPVRMGPLHVASTGHRLNAPFVQAKIADPFASLAPDYLSTIAIEATLMGARDRLVKHGAGPSLLEALLSAALVNEYDAAAWRSLWTHRLLNDSVSQTLPVNQTIRVQELVGIETSGIAPELRAGAPVTVTATDAAMVGAMRFPTITGADSLFDTITKTVTGPLQLIDQRAVMFLKAALEDVRALAKRPAAELDRVLRGVLDAYAYRLDAWMTALATARLGFWRNKPESKGIAIGGFGWVEGLRPDTRPDSDGYIHAPSIHHAQTAAVLRSGHLNHRDAAGAALAIDLSSRRVRLALGLLEGVGAGQPLAALLGYRFERRLRDLSPLLAKYILPIRRLFPLNPPPGETTIAQQEAIAARDVVDGVKLIERRRGDQNGWLNGITPAITSNGDLEQIKGVAAEIDDLFDAVKDLLVAEGVHQLVGGNLERASAALGGLDRQHRPVDPEVIRTPRHGRAFTQRVGVLLSEDKPPPAWTAEPGGRALAEPRLNAWVGRMVGDPSRFRLGGVLRFPDTSKRALTPVSLADLTLDPLSVLILSQAGSDSRESELQQRVAAALGAQVSDAEVKAGAVLHLVDEGAGDAPGLAALEALLDRLRTVAMKHRPMTANDLAPPGTEAPPRPQYTVVAQRADAVEATISALRHALSELGLGDPDEQQLAAALDALSRAGLPDATPAAGGREALLAQAATVDSKARAALDRAAAVAAPPADASDVTRAEAQVARLRALLGPGFPVLVPFGVEGDEPIFASFASGAALTGGAPAVLHGWMAQMAAVKPRLDELAEALTASEFLGGPIPALSVGQLPHAPGARWIGLPLRDTTPAAVDLSLVVHAPGLDPATPPGLLAGLVDDSWTEVIPNATETTAIAFNYDAPGARPPQTMLLAVHPDPAATAWRPSQVLASINAAAEIAHVRAVRPQDLPLMGETLPLLYLPENFDTRGAGINFNAIAQAALAQVPDYLVDVLGKG